MCGYATASAAAAAIAASTPLPPSRKVETATSVASKCGVATA
jgi:hypothetical protein